ncbi:hypothetical protein ACFLQJ_02315 [Calditrichota bacterium]
MKRNDFVFASARDTSNTDELQSQNINYPSTLRILELDVTDLDTMKKSKEIVRIHSATLDLPSRL